MSLTSSSYNRDHVKSQEGLTRKGALHGQRDGQDSHEQLVGHGVDDAANNSLQLPAAGDPAVEQVRDAGIGKHAQGPGVGVVDNGIANSWGNDEAGKGEDIGHCVDVFMLGQCTAATTRRTTWSFPSTHQFSCRYAIHIRGMHLGSPLGCVLEVLQEACRGHKGRAGG